MEFTLFLEKIFFVVVIYERKAEQSPAFNTLVALKGKISGTLSIFIYDNSAIPSPPVNQELFYKHDPSNSGVSRAYNEASLLARKHNKQWLLLLDQDTELEPIALEKYHKSVLTYPTTKVFTPRMVDAKGIVSPFNIFLGKGIRVSNVKAGIHSFNSLKIINSGMLIHLDAFEKAGGFDERFPLDLSDFAFTDRLSKHNLKFALIDCSIRHQLSSGDMHKDLTKEFKRFEKFIRAIKVYKSLNEKSISIALNILPRSVMLSVKHKTYLFLQHGITSLFRS